MSAVKLPAIFSGFSGLKDRSYSIRFQTQELSAEDATELLRNHQKECWLIVAPSEDVIDQAEVPKAKPETGTVSKTPAQRLRGVLFVYWRQLGQPGDFEDFYRGRMERLIDQYKAKLDGEEAS